MDSSLRPGVRVVVAAAQALSDDDLLQAVNKLQQMLLERSQASLRGRGAPPPAPPPRFEPYGAVPPPPALPPPPPPGWGDPWAMPAAPVPPPAWTNGFATGANPNGGNPYSEQECGDWKTGQCDRGMRCKFGHGVVAPGIAAAANPDGMLALGRALGGFRFIRYRPPTAEHVPACWLQFDSQPNAVNAYYTLRADKGWAEGATEAVPIEFGKMNMTYPLDGRDNERGFYGGLPGMTGGGMVGDIPSVPQITSAAHAAAPVAAPVATSTQPGQQTVLRVQCDSCGTVCTGAAAEQVVCTGCSGTFMIPDPSSCPVAAPLA